MKRKDLVGIKEKGVQELRAMVSKKKEEAVKKKMEIFAGKEKNLKLYRNLRAEIAKILTLIREKEIIEKLQTKEAKDRKEKNKG